MARLTLLLAALAGAVVSAFLAAPTTHSQQPQDAYSWGFVPKGVVADQRVQQGMANLVNGSKVMSSAGVAGSLTYGTDLPHQSRGSVIDDTRLLFAAAGFSEPGGQLSQGRRCRFWVPAGSTQDLITVAYALGRELSLSLAQVAVKIEPCEPAMTSADADIFVIPSGFPAPFGRNDAPLTGQSFLISADQQPQPPSSGTQLTAPTTGDGGLLR